MRTKFKTLTISHNNVVFEGWAPIAKIDVALRTIKSYSTYNSAIDALGDTLYTKHCDHCGHNKIVHTAYVMQNGDKIMKVGGGCMKSLAPASASAIAQAFDIFDQWSKVCQDAAKDPFAEPGSGGGRSFGGGGAWEGDLVFPKAQVIMAMKFALEETGGEWVTSEYSYENVIFQGTQTTILNKGKRTFDKIEAPIKFSYIVDQNYVKQMSDAVATVVSQYPDKVRQPEALEAMKAFVEGDKIKLIDMFLIKKSLGIVERAEKHKKMMESTFLVANVGDKVVLEVELVDTRHGESAYGGWTLNIFKDNSGNMYKKFGTLADRFKLDDTHYKFVAPIKAFETYQEVKYTVLGGPLSKVKPEKKTKQSKI